MRIVVTGINGQVGGALLSCLPGHEVIGLDRSALDLAQPAGVAAAVRALKPDVICNAAAYTDVEGAETDEAVAHAVNALSVGELAAAARACGAILVHYSTDYVFDGTKAEPYAEDDAPNPVSAYGRTKLEGEERIQASGCAHLIARTSWVYCGRGRNFLKTMLRLARERPEIRVVDDQIGSPTYAGFLAEATACIIGSIETDQRNRSRVEAGELLHLSNDGATSWHGFAAEIFAQFAARFGMRTPRLTAIATKDFPTRARRPANSRLSIERARNDWSLSIPYWQASLTDCFMREGEALAAQLR